MEVRGYEMLGEGGIKWFRMVCQSFNYSTFIHVCIHNWQIPFKLEVFGLKPTVGCLRFENVQNIARVIVLLIMIHAQFLRNAPPSPENSNSFASWIKSKKEASPPPPPPHPLKTILYPLPFWDLILNRAACNGPFWKWKVLIE